MAMAKENSVLIQPNSDAIGIWNTPKEARIAKLTRMIALPAMRIGIKLDEDFEVMRMPFPSRSHGA